MVTYVKSLNKNPLWGLGWQTELPWPKLDELHSAAIDPTKLDLAKHLQSTHACMDPYLCICVCMYVCTYVCMCLFISIYIYIHILIDIPPYATAMMHMPCPRASRSTHGQPDSLPQLEALFFTLNPKP